MDNVFIADVSRHMDAPPARACPTGRKPAAQSRQL